MDWLKKNIVLVIGGVISLAIVGGAGWYLYSQIQAEQEVEEKLAAIRSELSTLEGQTPYPNKENLEAAQAQLTQIGTFLDKANLYFGAMTTNRAPKSTEFSSMLLQTIDDLKRSARAANVSLPTNFAFGFTAQRELLQFDTTNITKVVSQVEDVKALATVLFEARVYEVIGIQRAPVSANDTNALTTQGTDYLRTKKVTTNEFSTISPYVATFKCSTPELGAVLDGLARAQYGFFVKWVKVEPAEAAAEGEGGEGATPAAGQYRSLMMRYGSRYGMRPGPTAEGSTEPGTLTEAQKLAKKVGVILNEKPLKVAILIEVIKVTRGV